MGKNFQNGCRAKLLPRSSAISRNIKAAITLGSKGGEMGAHFQRLGIEDTCSSIEPWRTCRAPSQSAQRCLGNWPPLLAAQQVLGNLCLQLNEALSKDALR